MPRRHLEKCPTTFSATNLKVERYTKTATRALDADALPDETLSQQLQVLAVEYDAKASSESHVCAR
jgi:hypothetical protein